MNKFAKFSALLVAVVTLVSGAMLYMGTASAQSVSVSLGQKYVSNNAVADSTVTVTVTDVARNGNAGSADTVAASATVVKNLTTGESVTLALTESGANTGIFTGTYSVTSSTTTGTTIKAADGETINVSYTTAGNLTITALTSDSVAYSTVDATGPVISNKSPADATSSRSQSQLFQAEVTDAGIGVGATASAVQGNNTITVDSAAFSPVVTDLGSGSWRISVGLTLSEAAHTWSITALDALGNSTTATDLDVEIDLTPPALVTSGSDKAGTGATADTSTTAGAITASSNRKSIRVGFSDKLSGASIDADGSDFRILLDNADLDVEKAEWFDKTNLNDHVFITLVNDMPADAAPVVRIVGDIQDDAGNTTAVGEITATDGLKPVITATLTGTSTSGRAATSESITLSISTDETVVAPVISTAAVTKVGTNNNVATTTAETANSFTTVAAGTSFEWVYKFTDAADKGLYNVYISLTDTSGNTQTSGHASDAGNSSATLFEVDKAVGAVAVTPSSTDDAEAFVNLAYTAEDDEYTTGALTHDSHTTVSVSSITVDGTAATINTIDNITYTLAAPSGGWTVGDHTVAITAVDNAGNSLAETKTFTVTTRAALSIALKPGFNLISLSGEPTSNDINDVIASTHPINMVMTYDPSAAGGWLVAERNPDNGNKFEGTLSTIDSSTAYLVRTTTFQALEVLIPRVKLAERALPRTVSLSAGWNFVPVLDLSGDQAAGASQSAADYFGSVSQVMVLGIDAEGHLAPATTVAVGSGYLVYMDGADTLVPPQ